MSQGLLVFILSVIVFVAGALFINYSVKHEEAKEAKKAAEAQDQAKTQTKKAA